VEGSNRDLIEALSRRFAGGTEEYHQKSQYDQYPSSDFNLVRPECKSETLPVEAICLVRIC
jgi:hypothetical protein